MAAPIRVSGPPIGVKIALLGGGPNKSCKTGSQTLKDSNQKSGCLRLGILGSKIGNICLFWAPGLIPSREYTPPHTVSLLTVFVLRCSFMITSLKEFLTRRHRPSHRHAEPHWQQQQHTSLRKGKERKRIYIVPFIYCVYLKALRHGSHS